ncbi:D-alanyl-D-alanine carboxypeptidase family protein [Zavarzinia compransoris]|uniref:D-alanyl-D-alanine carboxypeptidase family protein n=1 Tax=Zavarzinia compransoris TaxID=1264899 RepID=UPI0010E312FE|nr:D-alanyl-D-alanine carboxypeptidase family protein [Zavarzinia compransoris]TDP44887.1 D-alanyl-D-alanine carboxypeptidase (penicillin-binding protein 5/6) [Zavarzinia compransoris]
MPHILNRRLVMALAGLALLAAPFRAACAEALETPAREAVLIDLSTDTVLFEKNADAPMVPSSMTKLMTIYLLFDKLAKGAIKMEDELPVSERAWRMGGSKMFVHVGDRVKVSDLLRGIIVQSGNDACIVVAEGLSSTEEAFAAQMTARGKDMGLKSSTFRNASGWPDPQHRMTARDLALLGERLILDFPQYYPLFAERSFKYNNIEQANRDPLLGVVPGADGLKTGHTDEGGYGLVGSAIRDGRRLLLVVNGLTSMRERAQESARILEWGFREFQTYTMAKKGETLAEARVWQGDEDTVPLTVAQDARVTLRRVARATMVVKVVYDGPVPAPIKAGDQIARLEITAPDMPAISLPLVAGRDVERQGFVGRIFTSLRYLVAGDAS